MSALADDLRPLTAQKYAVAVLAGTQRAAAALARDLAAAGFSAQAYHKEPPVPLRRAAWRVFEGHLNAGADYPFAKFAVFTSRRHNAAAPQKARAKNKGLSSLSDITPGDYVVHQNHGIGVYAGIQRLDLQGVVKDYIKINYDKARHAVCARYPAGPYQPLYRSRRRRARQAVEAGRRRVEQDQKPRAQGHAGDGQRADRFVRPAPAGPGLCLPRGRRVAAGF